MRTEGGCGLGRTAPDDHCRWSQGPVAMANPEIVARNGATLSLEGCLSLANSMSQVWRSSKVTVEELV